MSDAPKTIPSTESDDQRMPGIFTIKATPAFSAPTSRPAHTNPSILFRRESIPECSEQTFGFIQLVNYDVTSGKLWWNYPLDDLKGFHNLCDYLTQVFDLNIIGGFLASE